MLFNPKIRKNSMYKVNFVIQTKEFVEKHRTKVGKNTHFHLDFVIGFPL